MSEHENFMKIIDTIGYELPSYLGITYYEKKILMYLGEDMLYKKHQGGMSSQGWYSFGNKLYRKVDVREIIYTQEFMDKFLSFLEDKWKTENSHTEEAFIGVHIRILDSLNYPVSYLYNLLGLGEK